MSLLSLFSNSKSITETNKIDDFTGRSKQCNLFKEAYLQLKNCIKKSKKISPIVVNYYGEVGCGKTRLLQKLNEVIQSPKKGENLDFSQLYGEDIRFVYWNFKDGGKEIDLLLNFKKRLLVHSFDLKFPLFELGYYFYKTKIDGENLKDPRKRQSFLESNPTLGLVLNAANNFPLFSQFSMLITLADKSVSFFKEIHDRKKQNIDALAQKLDDPNVDITPEFNSLMHNPSDN